MPALLRVAVEVNVLQARRDTLFKRKYYKDDETKGGVWKGKERRKRRKGRKEAKRAKGYSLKGRIKLRCD